MRGKEDDDKMSRDEDKEDEDDGDEKDLSRDLQFVSYGDVAQDDNVIMKVLRLNGRRSTLAKTTKLAQGTPVAVGASSLGSS